MPVADPLLKQLVEAFIAEDLAASEISSVARYVDV